MNILIVDDHEENLYLLDSLFKGNGHTVRSAFNGAEALEILKAGGIDLIISDILMPVMDGFQLCRKVKTDEALRAIPLIIYTATYTGPKDEALALKIGADRFIVKPCEPEDFMSAIEAVMAAAEDRDGNPAPMSTPEEEVLKLYNESLVRKLEKKMAEAEREIAARREAEKALRVSEEKYRSILNNIEAGFYEVDLAGNFTFFNHAMCKILSYSSSELMRKNNQEFMDPENAKKIFQTFNRVFTTGIPAKGFNWQLIRKDGRICWLDTSVFLMRDDSGQAIGFQGIVQDITARKLAELEREKLQGQLVQAQKMESVGRLAGGVAHDFNNMLSVILGYTELALQKVDPSAPLHADLEEILKAAKRSAIITRQLLAFARKQTIAPKVLDINETVESMLKMLRRLIGEDIDLAWLPENRLWPVKIDPSQIEQVLANLCVNARDAIAGVGKVTIETNTVTFDDMYCADHAGFVPGEFVLLAVSDDGCGMDKETLDSIFEPFFTTKDESRGTGLGLAMVYGIVKQNNGLINVYSEPDKGTTFRIYLPRHEGKAEKIRVQSVTEIPTGRGEMVLLVEDDHSIRKLCQKMLKRLGYQVLTAATPGEALRLAGAFEGAIHLLITDVVMPEMNGRELADQLNALFTDIKTLFMSGYTANVIVHRGTLEEGVNFIQKPFSVKDLGVKVRAILDQK